jgi:putative FmdB family regulatory protein
MPTYEYACKDCGEHLEVAQSFKDDPLTECPACHGQLRKVFGNIGIAFKGSGFYKTDSRSDGRKATAKSADGKSADGGSTTKATEGSSGSKTEGSKTEGSKTEGSKTDGAKPATSEGTKSTSKPTPGSSTSVAAAS